MHYAAPELNLTANVPKHIQTEAFAASHRLHRSGPDPLNSSRNESYLLSCFTGAWQKIMDRLLMKTGGVGQDMCIAFA